MRLVDLCLKVRNDVIGRGTLQTLPPREVEQFLPVLQNVLEQCFLVILRQRGDTTQERIGLAGKLGCRCSEYGHVQILKRAEMAVNLPRHGRNGGIGRRRLTVWVNGSGTFSAQPSSRGFWISQNPTAAPPRCAASPPALPRPVKTV